jgi:holo-[acyl-carrier-protein] synthase
LSSYDRSWQGQGALKTGWRGKITWQDIEVVNDADGVPSLNVSGEAAVLLDGLAVDVAHLSISHTTEHATAHVIFERR